VTSEVGGKIQRMRVRSQAQRTFKERVINMSRVAFLNLVQGKMWQIVLELARLGIKITLYN
jgi:hypothetical protein